MNAVTQLLPRPTSVRSGQGEFVLSRDTAIVAGDELTRTAVWLQSALRPATGLPLPLRDTGPSLRDAGLSLREAGDGAITLVVRPELGAEAYRLRCEPGGVTIAGGDAAGVFYGCQTLLQLLPPAVFRRSRVTGTRWALPATAITDAPRFRWRGAMLDVARHFMPKHDLLRFVDLLAMHRLNTLHLHLSDDQGWRLEIPRYPRLTEVGAWREESQLGVPADAPGDGRPHGGYYTTDDVREIVGYAAERHITVVPEIDVPGHSQAAIAAYPELGVSGEPCGVWTRWGVNHRILNTEDSTVAFYRAVLDEVMDLFPGTYIGIGGDECPKDEWRTDPRTQELIRRRGLNDEHDLQSWFLAQLGEHLASRGRRVYGWDDILEGDVPPGALVASWRGMTGAVTAARRGFDVVACPDDQVYLDYRQSELENEPVPFSVPLTLADAYAFDPVPEGLSDQERARILGGQANVWTEHMDSPRTVDYYVFPRLCAIAEALWSEAGRDFPEFLARLDTQLRRLDAIGVEYRGAGGPMPWQTRPGVRGLPADRAEWASHIDALVAGIKT